MSCKVFLKNVYLTVSGDEKDEDAPGDCCREAHIENVYQWPLGQDCGVRPKFKPPSSAPPCPRPKRRGARTLLNKQPPMQNLLTRKDPPSIPRRSRLEEEEDKVPFFLHSSLKEHRVRAGKGEGGGAFEKEDGAHTSEVPTCFGR